MSVDSTGPASRTPAPRTVNETPVEAGLRALVADVAAAGIPRGNYKFLVRNRMIDPEIEIWMPRAGYSETRAAFEKIFKAAAFTTKKVPDAYQPSVERQYPADQNGVIYSFHVDEVGGAARL